MQKTLSAYINSSHWNSSFLDLLPFPHFQCSKGLKIPGEARFENLIPESISRYICYIYGPTDYRPPFMAVVEITFFCMTDYIDLTSDSTTSFFFNISKWLLLIELSEVELYIMYKTRLPGIMILLVPSRSNMIGRSDCW